MDPYSFASRTSVSPEDSAEEQKLTRADLDKDEGSTTNFLKNKPRSIPQSSSLSGKKSESKAIQPFIYRVGRRMPTVPLYSIGLALHLSTYPRT
jgi:hypothetical protein